MKPTSYLFPAAGVSTLGLLVALAGCANAPTRVATAEAAASPALVAPANGNFTAPVPVRTVSPKFPFAMRLLGVSGIVVLNCLVGEDGAVREAEVVKASAREFEQPALEAIKQWTFTPARSDGTSVAQRVQIPMNFTFTD